jgi:GTPase SAR1 family protein
MSPSPWLHETTAFHPFAALMAIFGGTNVVRLYEIHTTQFYAGMPKVDGIQYTNAKVVLLGDSGVGKSGLGLVLSRQSFEPTESTHGCLVWTFSRQESELPDGRREIRETLLWDLAGQPGYRLTHQLHLSEVTVALVVFDAHSETNPLAGISHWVRALRTAQRVRGNMAGLKMLLVLARIDRGGKRISRGRIDEIVQGAGFDAYFETSAKEGTNIAELCSAIEKAIDWEQLPKVTSTELFQRIRTFLIAEKQAERLLTTVDDLYRTFLRTS